MNVKIRSVVRKMAAIFCYQGINIICDWIMLSCTYVHTYSLFINPNVDSSMWMHVYKYTRNNAA